jgi:hypothetical protein
MNMRAQPLVPSPPPPKHPDRFGGRSMNHIPCSLHSRLINTHNNRQLDLTRYQISNPLLEDFLDNEYSCSVSSTLEQCYHCLHKMTG